MFGDPLSITYNGASKALAKVNQDGNGSDYYLDDGSSRYRLIIRHTIPSSPSLPGEQHHMRLYVEDYDAEGVYLRTSSPWFTAKAEDAPQVTTKATYAANALIGLLTPANVTKLLAREV